MTITIELVDFKKYAATKFVFDSKATLISGESGCGKTTVLDAIKFALTGEGRQLIRYGCKRCSVTFTAKACTIHRCKGPNSVTLTTVPDGQIEGDGAGRRTYVGAEADTVIRTVFVNWWVGFVDYRKLFRSFISMTAVEKLKYIAQISSGDFDLELVHDRMRGLIADRRCVLNTCVEQTSSLRKILTDLEARAVGAAGRGEAATTAATTAARFTSVLPCLPVDMAVEELDLHLDRISSSRARLLDTRGHRTHIMTTLNRHRSQSVELGVLIERNRDALSKVLLGVVNDPTTVNTYLEKGIDSTRLIQLHALQNRLTTTTSEACRLVEELLEVRQRRGAEDGSLVEPIVTTLNTIKTDLVGCNRSRDGKIDGLITRCLAYTKDVSSTCARCIDILNQLIELDKRTGSEGRACERTLAELQLRRRNIGVMIECSLCHGKSAYHWAKLFLPPEETVDDLPNGVQPALPPADLAIVSLSEAQSVESRLVRLREKVDGCHDLLATAAVTDKKMRDAYTRLIQTYSIRDTSESDRTLYPDWLERMVHQLDTIRYIERHLLAIRDKLAVIVECTSSSSSSASPHTNSLDSMIVANKHALDTITSICSDIAAQTRNRDYVEREIGAALTDLDLSMRRVRADLPPPLLSTHEPDAGTDDYSSASTLLDLSIDLYETVLTALKTEREGRLRRSYEDELKGRETAENEARCRLNDAVKLHEFVKTAERDSMKHIIENVNVYSQLYVDRFFPNETTLVQLKFVAAGGDRVRNRRTAADVASAESSKLVLEIEHNGTESVDVSTSLSGGEYARLALAFTLAFVEIYEGEVLFLDESLATLDADTTGVVMDAIRRTFNGQIICISHQATTGAFDKVIHL